MAAAAACMDAGLLAFIEHALKGFRVYLNAM